jgi:hypothetical protein
MLPSIDMSIEQYSLSTHCQSLQLPPSPKTRLDAAYMSKCMIRDIVLKNTDAIPAGLTGLAKH